MKKVHKITMFVLIAIVGVVSLVTVSAKSYEYILHYGITQSVSFVKYNCENNVHTAIKASSLNGASSIEVLTEVFTEKDEILTKVGDNRTLINTLNFAYETNFSNTGGGDTMVRWTNLSKGTTLQGRFYINNGLA